MAIKEKVYLQLLTPSSLATREDGVRIIHLWKQYLARYLPDRVGNYEPLDHSFNVNDMEALLHLWQWPFLAHRRTPRMDAQVFMRKGSTQHASWAMSIDYDPLTVEELVEFMSVASVELRADFGCITLLTPDEIISGRENGTVTALDRNASRFSFFIPNPYLLRSLPDVYWLTVLGPAYVRYFGLDRVLAAPAYAVARLATEYVRIQLTPYLEDMHRAAVFAKAREALKEYLGPAAFLAERRDAPRPVFDWK